jgi:hypothetical protein
MKYDIYNHREFCVASDTDSCFFEATPQLIKRLGEQYNSLPEEVLINEVQKIAEENSNKINTYLNSLTKKLFNVPINRIEFKTETIIKSAYWSGKRRYAQYIVNKEGIDVEELDMKGLDIMKSNFPPFFRDFGEQVIKNILFSVPKKDIDEQVLNFRESLRTVDWKQILKPTGLKKFDEYVERSPGAGEIFSKLALKCPINTKAAIYTADILKFKGLDKKYPPPQIGDKIYIVYLKENPYHIDVISLNGYDDAPELLEFAQKYIDRDGIFDGVLKNKLENLYKDINWGQPIFNRKVNKFFTFN